MFIAALRIDDRAGAKLARRAIGEEEVTQMAANRFVVTRNPHPRVDEVGIMWSMQEDDIGPDDSMELETVEIGESNPDIEVILDVRLNRHEMSAVQSLASEWGVPPSRAIKRLVDEGLHARARGST
jgi:hypothetical protein